MDRKKKKGGFLGLSFRYLALGRTVGGELPSLMVFLSLGKKKKEVCLRLGKNLLREEKFGGDYLAFIGLVDEEKTVQRKKGGGRSEQSSDHCRSIPLPTVWEKRKKEARPSPFKHPGQKDGPEKDEGGEVDAAEQFCSRHSKPAEGKKSVQSPFLCPGRSKVWLNSKGFLEKWIRRGNSRSRFILIMQRPSAGGEEVRLWKKEKEMRLCLSGDEKEEANSFPTRRPQTCEKTSEEGFS